MFVTIAKDKRQHLLIGIAMVLVGSIFILPLYAMIIATIVGIAKEYRDSLGHGTPEFCDLTATATGAQLAFIAIELIKLAI